MVSGVGQPGQCQTGCKLECHCDDTHLHNWSGWVSSPQACFGNPLCMSISRLSALLEPGRFARDAIICSQEWMRAVAPQLESRPDWCQAQDMRRQNRGAERFQAEMVLSRRLRSATKTRRHAEATVKHLVARSTWVIPKLAGQLRRAELFFASRRLEVQTFRLMRQHQQAGDSGAMSHLPWLCIDGLAVRCPT